MSIGTPQRGIEFCDFTGFPRDRLIADPENILYSSLGLYKGPSTFFSLRTPRSLLDRFLTDGAQDLLYALGKWKPYLPPELDQSFQQGGCLLFDGQTCLFQHFDEGPGDHVDFDVLIKKACCEDQYKEA